MIFMVVINVFAFTDDLIANAPFVGKLSVHLDFIRHWDHVTSEEAV